MKYRKMWALLMVLVLLLSLVGCGKEQVLAQEKQILQDHWKIYLAATEEIYEQMHLAFDAAEIFAEDNQWESLCNARWQCNAAKRAVLQIEAPEYILTDSQHSALMDAGIEAEVVLAEIEAFEIERETAWNTLTALENKLDQDVFLEPAVETLPQWIVCNRGVVADVSEYLCLCTNYLALQLGDAGLWQKLPEIYPNIGACRGEWSDDGEKLMLNATDVMDRYESRFIEMAGFEAVAEYTLELVRDAVETDDLTRLSAQIHEIQGVPGYFPIPSWMPADAVHEYTEKGGLMITCGEIPWERLKEEATALLPAMEIRIDISEEDERILFWFGDCELSVSTLQDGSRALLMEKDKMGCLIPRLYLEAMGQK